ncbi:MAG: hypothetical protein QNJ97_07145 [Myxococcota bacterium]|nr:hypothetical protein [Myxococcota bacterium]
MVTKETFIKKIEERKANREYEISQIPIRWLRKRYQRKLGSDDIMREFFLEVGDFLLKYCNNPFIRPIFHLDNAVMGPYRFKWQFRLGRKPKPFIESVLDYYMFFTSYGAWPVDIDEVGEKRVVMYMDKCTVKCEAHLPLCLAATSMEPQLSKKSWYGATVTYAERIPDGAKRCKLVFEQK